MADKKNTEQKPLQNFFFLKLESANPVVAFSYYLHLPLWVIFLLVGLTVLLAQMSEDRARNAEKRSRQFAILMLWGSFNSLVCFLGIAMYTWLVKAGEPTAYTAILKAVLFYTLLILITRSIGFLIGVKFEAKKPRNNQTQTSGQIGQ